METSSLDEQKQMFVLKHGLAKEYITVISDTTFGNIYIKKQAFFT